MNGFPIKNDEIKSLISQHFKSEKDKSILIDRYINCFSFEEIIGKYFPDMRWSSEKRLEAFKSKNIRPLFNKLGKVLCSNER